MIQAAKDVGRIEYEIEQLEAKQDRINTRIGEELADLRRRRDEAAKAVAREGGQ
jgi:hypothetical protein